ncbi:putative membrane protein [Gluconacetobacter diazotrophicus PA1 5]|uniref:Putative membrane protein n=1 Tax=Gluconacetobacter diazotrophicus (strain ATCC 49037 / DSM 5601 / CCUG 37298 / CIP 103539 / LMG 7603 / PAl5) TaxID=272568 RepID=A9HGI1_GLUDA|nr:hypothetical protein FBZ86_1519 [Gluconacetobacter diazotrophicus]CAP55503.1 putative membrane protein [Gluconacetobacter diazotrophicus PA1 5]
MFKERIFDLFEQCVMTILSAIIMLIASVSLLHLTVSVVVIPTVIGTDPCVPIS